jgi:hypothetical protein
MMNLWNSVQMHEMLPALSIGSYRKPTSGYIALWLSEVGAPSDLATILRHADNHLHPTWLNGGLYYLRCDVGADNDADGNWTFMDPFPATPRSGTRDSTSRTGRK